MSSRDNEIATALAAARGPLTVLFLISLVSNLLMLTGPLFMLQIYDRVLASYSVPTLVALSLLVAGLYVFYAFIEWMRTRMAIRFAGMIDEALAGDLFRASIRLKAMPGAGRVDPVRDLDTLRQFAAGPGPLSIFDLPWMPFYLGIIFLFHPMLGWLSVGGACVITLLLIVNELSAQKPSQEVTLAAGKRQVQSDDARSNAESVLSMGMLESVTRRWMQASTAFVTAQHRAADWTAFYSSVTKSFRFLLQSAVLAVGAYLVIRGEITAGLMIAASIVSSRALAPVEQVVAHWRGFVSARQALGRIKTVASSVPAAAARTELPLPSRSLTIRQLSTGPDRQRKPLLSDISFSLEAGEGLGVLGLSGSGKTSLARALVGVWPVLQGEIRLDGSELDHYDATRLGAAIGYLPQVVDLFDGTIAENIARFRTDGSDGAILKAAAAAQTHDLITSLPDGYDTRIGERGAILSAGQRQRIGLARALYGDPFLLVLDEPNSNLDSEGDAALTAALNGAKERGAIIVVVAHRPSAIVATDKILFLKGGRQATFGPKDEVLRSITQNSTVATPAFGASRSHG